jgi:hypothetical protein
MLRFSRKDGTVLICEFYCLVRVIVFELSVPHDVEIELMIGKYLLIFGLIGFL